MKKALCILAIFMLSISISARSFADGPTQLDNLDRSEPGYTEISSLEEEISVTLEEYLEELGKPALSEDFTVDFSSAYKIYVDTNILELNTTDKTKILQELEKSKYVWLLPIYHNGDTFLVHISKGLPVDESAWELLAEEEIKELEAGVGKWQVAAVEIVEDKVVDYEKTVADATDSLTEMPENAETVICGGLRCITQPAAIVLDNDDSLLIPLSDLTIEGSEEQIQEIQPEGADIDNPVYYYADIREAISEMDTENMEGSGMGDGYIALKQKRKMDSFTLCLVAGILVCTAMLVCYSLFDKRRAGGSQ